MIHIKTGQQITLGDYMRLVDMTIESKSKKINGKEYKVKYEQGYNGESYVELRRFRSDGWGDWVYCTDYLKDKDLLKFYAEEGYKLFGFNNDTKKKQVQERIKKAQSELDKAQLELKQL